MPQLVCINEMILRGKILDAEIPLDERDVPVGGIDAKELFARQMDERDKLKRGIQSW